MTGLCWLYSSAMTSTTGCYPTKLGSTHPTPSKANPLILGCGEGKCSVYCRTKQGEGAAHAQKTQTLWWISGKDFLRQCEGEGHRVCYQLVYNSVIVGWWGNRVMFHESQSSASWFQSFRGLCADGQHTVNFFHLVRVSISAKIAQGYGSGYYL